MTHDEALEVLDQLLELEEGLTDWEMDFIESLNQRRGREFSEKQVAVLEKLERRLLK